MTQQLVNYGVTPWAKLPESKEEVEKDMREGLRWLQHCTKLSDPMDCLLFLVYDAEGSVVGIRMVFTQINEDYSLIYDDNGLALYCIEYETDIIGDKPHFDVTDIEEVVDGDYQDLPTMLGSMVSIYFNEVLCED